MKEKQLSDNAKLILAFMQLLHFFVNIYLFISFFSIHLFFILCLFPLKRANVQKVSTGESLCVNAYIVRTFFVFSCVLSFFPSLLPF